MKHLIFMVLIFLLLSGCQKEVIKSPEMGNIAGRVVVDPALEDAPANLAGIDVRIVKTDITAYTDSAGQYLFLNIPEGTYSLEANERKYPLYGHLEGVEVVSGGTRQATDLVLGSFIPNQPSFFVYSLRLIDSSGSEYTIINNDNLVTGKKYEIQGMIEIYSSGNLNYYPDTSISIKLNDQPRITLNTVKGWFSSDISLSDGENILQIWLGTSDNPSYVSDPYRIYSLKSLNSVDIQLGWDSYSSGGGDAGDFDLHLINNQNGDSCWYKNPEPDWGYPGATFDNPRLSRDENPYGYSSGDEDIGIISAAQGSYTIRVHYFSNHSDSLKTIRPTVRLRLKDNSSIYLTAPTSMKVGDLWTVSQFSFIDGNSIQNMNIIQAGPAGEKK